MTTMPAANLRLAVADCLAHRDPTMRGLEAILQRLSREPPEAVTEAYDAVLMARPDGHMWHEGKAHGLLAARMRKLHRPLRGRSRLGITVSELARQLGMARETLAKLMEYRGLLEMVPYGRAQSRRLVTDDAFDKGLGHNADPSNKLSHRIDGSNRASVFPVFYQESLPHIILMIGWDTIQGDSKRIANKRSRMQWLLTTHPYLPDQALADLGNYSLRGVKKARSQLTGCSG